ESFGEPKLGDGQSVDRGNDRIGEQDDAVTFALDERRPNCVGEAPARVWRRSKSIDDDEQLFRAGDVALRRLDFVEMLYESIDGDVLVGFFCSIATAGESSSTGSTSGFSIRSRNWRA